MTDKTSGLSVMERAKAHQRKVLTQKPRSFYVEEWETTFYIRPTMTLQQKCEITELAESGQKAKSYALTIVYNMWDEDGKPVFRKVQIDELTKEVNCEVLERIATEIGRDEPTVEELEKN
jgi:hypothetical protein